MTPLDDLLSNGGPRQASRSDTARAEVSKAPATATDGMAVVLFDYSRDLEYEVPAGHWAPRGTSLPALGDRCLVVFDTVGDVWVPAWEGLTVHGAGGPAGGVLAGSFPNPSFAVDMATEAELQAEVTALEALLAAKAPLADPVFTGNPQAPTPAPGDADTSVATTAFVAAAAAEGVIAACRARRTTTMTITSGGWTIPTFDAEDFDSMAMHDPATNPSRITIPAGRGGLYLVGASAAWGSGEDTENRVVQVLVDGTTVVGEIDTSHAGTSDNEFAVAEPAVLSAGSYIQMRLGTGSTSTTLRIGALLWAVYLGRVA